MQAAQQRVPCHNHYTLEILEQLRHMPDSKTLRDQARQHIERVLDNNPSHGLAYYRAGQLADPADAQRWWRAGLADATTHGERQMLTSHAEERVWAESLAYALKQRDGYPGAMNHAEVWQEAHTSCLSATRRLTRP